MTKCCSGR